MKIKLILCIFLLLFLVITGCKKEKDEVWQGPDYSGKWVGVANDGSQLGIGGDPFFTFLVSQNGANVSGSVIIEKIFAEKKSPNDTITVIQNPHQYIGNLAGKVVNEEGKWIFRGSFDLEIDNCPVHIIFNCTYRQYYGERLIGSYNGTNGCLGEITDDAFVLHKK